MVALLKDAASKTGSRVVGELWALVHGIPGQKLLDVSEEYERSPVSQESSSEESHRVYILSLLDRMVGRLYEAIPVDDLDRIDRMVLYLTEVFAWRISYPSARAWLSCSLIPQSATYTSSSIPP